MGSVRPVLLHLVASTPCPTDGLPKSPPATPAAKSSSKSATDHRSGKVESCCRASVAGWVPSAGAGTCRPAEGLPSVPSGAVAGRDLALGADEQAAPAVAVVADVVFHREDVEHQPVARRAVRVGIDP